MDQAITSPDTLKSPRPEGNPRQQWLILFGIVLIVMLLTALLITAKTVWVSAGSSIGGKDAPSPTSNFDYIQTLHAQYQQDQQTLRDSLKQTTAELAKLRAALTKPEIPESETASIPEWAGELLLTGSIITADVAILRKELGTLGESLGKTPQKQVRAAVIHAKDLPFEVVSIDFWNGLPRVAIAYGDAEQALLGLKESRMGWQIQQISVEQQHVEFKNQHGQTAVVRKG